MREYSIEEIRKWFARAVNECAFGHTRVIVKRHGKPVVALVPIEDFERLEKLDERKVERSK